MPGACALLVTLDKMVDPLVALITKKAGRDRSTERTVTIITAEYAEYAK